MEDDGISFDYENGRVARTRIVCKTEPRATTVCISRREGEYEGMPLKRSYEIVVHTDNKPTAVLTGGERRRNQSRRVRPDPSRGWTFDRLTGTTRLVVEEARGQEAEVRIEIVHSERGTRKSGDVVRADAVDSTSRHLGKVRGASPGIAAGNDETDELLVTELRRGNLDGTESALAAWWENKMSGEDSSAWPLYVMQACHLIVKHAERNGKKLEMGTAVADAGATAVEESSSESAKGVATQFQIPPLLSPEQGYAWLQQQVQQLAKQFCWSGSAVSHPVIRELLIVIEREIDGDLSLHAVADRLSLHPFYLSRLFRQQTGRTYTEYTMSMRMQKAKEVLEAGGKVYEAAVCSGFKDAGNFSKAFRKYWGLPPTRFKEKLK
jgi:AraC-like DNA-binding protein